MSPWVEISTGGILALLIIDKVFSFVKYRNGNGHITVAEFRANIDSFKEHHETEQALTKGLLANMISQTEILREWKLGNDRANDHHETDMRATLEALRTLILTMESMGKVLEKLESRL